MIIYQLTLPKKHNANAFVEFMNKEYFPAVHKGPTRSGQVTELILLARENESHEFFWHVGWEGIAGSDPHLDDPKIESKFEAFEAEVKRIGSYEEVAVWRDQTAI